jgi:hypothetical protein
VKPIIERLIGKFSRECGATQVEIYQEVMKLMGIATLNPSYRAGVSLSAAIPINFK